MEGFEKREQQLSRKLQSLCDNKGREVSHEEAAPYLHELGLLYIQKSPDKISLVQSAALLNAAIIRQPSEQTFQHDLTQLCNHVLRCANAKDLKANLIEISKQVKEMVFVMRSETTDALRKIKCIPETVTIERALYQLEKRKIKQVRAMQCQIAQKYSDIMAFVSNQCIKIMGMPPCRYALVGMGSLAREEITPYSDFEHIIVLEESLRKTRQNRKSILEYFRWYSVIFHIIIINLQETIIPSVCIYGLNDSSNPNGDWFYDKFTTRGISFDGMMLHACKFPLGRTKKTENKPFATELIKPISEMVKYLYVEEDLKNGYKLGDILTKTCFVAGNKYIYGLFLSKLNKIQLNQKITSIPLIVSQLKEDLVNYEMTDKLHEMKFLTSWNIKRVMYRSITLFTSALGRLCGSNQKSNFDVIDELEEREVVNMSTAHKLSLAVAIACHVRLQRYMSKKSQNDYAQQCTDFIPGKLNLQHNLVTKRELVNFFCCIQTLQCFLKDGIVHYNLNDYFEKKMLEYTLLMKRYLGLCDEVIDEGLKHMRDKEIKSIDHFMILYNVGKAYIMKSDNSTAYTVFQKIMHSPMFSEQSASFCSEMHSNMLQSKLNLAHYKAVSQETANVIRTAQYTDNTTFFLLNGIANTYLNEFHKALSSFRTFMSSAKAGTSTIRYNHSTYVRFMKYVAFCLLHSGHHERALGWLFELLEACDQLTNCLHHRANCYGIIADCYSVMGFENQAERYRNMIIEKLSGQPIISEELLYVFTPC